RVQLRRQQLVLRVRDRRVYRPRREVRGRDVQRLQRLLDHPRLIAGVINRKPRRQPHPLRVMLQDPQPHPLKRTDRRPPPVRPPPPQPPPCPTTPPQPVPPPSLHPPRRLVGERDPQDRLLRDAQRDQVRHPPGNPPRLPRPSRRHDQQRPVHVRHRLPLRRGQ